jgi:hypothetical protein
MKLTTLLEYKACFDLLKSKESENKRLDGSEYIRCVRAQGRFNSELEKVADIEVEVVA